MSISGLWFVGNGVKFVIVQEGAMELYPAGTLPLFL